MRLAILKKEKCRAPGECDYLCKRFCPRVRTGDKTVDIGPDQKPMIDENLCIGCGICVKKCQFDAISIINLPEALGPPVHQFGKNGFRLFGLPTPMEGKVVGLLGPNGTGKSTIVEILSGKITPNLGTGNESIEAVIERYAGTELQKHFENISRKKIRLVTKPQNIGLIPHVYKGRVDNFLKKTSPDILTSEWMKTFDLEEILERKTTDISGGELQRLAIATTLSRPADIYFIDEPSSFLDIKQRLNVARIIRSFAETGKTVVVVEHDLTILDYLSDMVHIVYGKPSAYGIVSLPKTTRTGINMYLDGYSKDENMRFREYGIIFDEHAPVEARNVIPLVKYDNLEIQLKSFHLLVHKGHIGKGQVVGVVGINGIGKTTFVKMLAGMIKPDNGKISTKVKVAYKPQEIRPTHGHTLVSTVINKAAGEATDINFEAEVTGPLELAPLFTKKLSELSGGELQRVAIASTIAKPADIYLFDEPSAFLDVEQRVRCAKAIKNVTELRKTTALVVDHDILFVDYLSSRLIVFEGAAARAGESVGPLSMEEGMNRFLKKQEITLRRDPDCKRPRINKFGSRLDQEQKAAGNYYYS